MAPHSKVKVYNQKYETANSSSKSQGKLQVAEKQVTKTKFLTYHHQDQTKSNQKSLVTTKAAKTSTSPAPKTQTQSFKSTKTPPPAARQSQTQRAPAAAKNKAPCIVNPFKSYSMAAPQPGFVETYERESYRREQYVSSGKGKQSGAGKAKIEQYECSRWVRSNNNQLDPDYY